jgi:DNA-binding NarL/FixJ family response regulator
MGRRRATVGSSKSKGATTPRVGPRGGRARVVLIDKKPLLRESIHRLLESRTDDLSVLSVASTAELFGARRTLQMKIHAVLLDIGSDGLGDAWARECLQILNRRLSNVPIIILSDSGDRTQMLDAFTHGARGYITTALSSAVAVEALRHVCAGGTFVPVSLLMDAIGSSDPSRPRNQLLGEGIIEGFTNRERQVLELLREGERNKIIARRLNLQESTVKVHVRRVIRKLHAKNRTQAAILSDRVFADKAPSPTDFPKSKSEKL